MKISRLNTQIYAEASDWLVEFRSGDIDARGRQEFYHWLRASPEHMRAYLELAAIWNEGPAVDPRRSFDDARLLQEVRCETNIVPMAVAAPTASAGCRARARPPRRGWVVAASLLVALGAGGYWYLDALNLYTTAVGEQRNVNLDDGSVLELNSNSRVRVRFIRTRRDLDLLEGQVLFHVAKEAGRAFVVHAGSTDIRAVGTQFDVYEKSTGATTVTVIEGRVAVLYTAAGKEATGGAVPAQLGSRGVREDTKHVGEFAQQADRNPPPVQDEGAGAMLLAAGEQVTVTGGGARRADHADVATATAWTQHQLVFKAASLQEVADEFNRYNSRRLVIRDTQLGGLKITGIFSSTDPTSLIRFLAARSDVAVTQTDLEIQVSRKP